MFGFFGVVTTEGEHLVEDNKLAEDEARRGLQHEVVKSEIEAEVGAEIADNADRATPGERARIENIAGDFRGKAIDEVVDTEREVDRSRTVARISQVIDYIFFIVYALLAIRLILALLAARSSAGWQSTPAAIGLAAPAA